MYADCIRHSATKMLLSHSDCCHPACASSGYDIMYASIASSPHKSEEAGSRKTGYESIRDIQPLPSVTLAGPCHLPALCQCQVNFSTLLLPMMNTHPCCPMTAEWTRAAGMLKRSPCR